MTKVLGFLAKIVFFLAAGVFCASPAQSAESRKAALLKVGYASITGGRISLWATHEMEFFARNGLETELIFIASSSQGVPALLAGEIPIFFGLSRDRGAGSCNGSRSGCHRQQRTDALQTYRSARHQNCG
jgi:ABC-type nitrate/sulfonate/bicarbonate transport system substrate-binding protein